jgi:hypothetical protein
MSEKLHICPGCNTPGFTATGLKAHKCKGPKAEAAELTTAEPRDPAWDQVRQIAAGVKLAGRLFVRGQVRLGMLLADLKKAHGRPEGRPSKNSAESAKFLSWAEIVERETGYSRRSADEFIRLYDATKAKLKTAKKLALPKEVKKDAIVLFQEGGALALTEEQWEQVDQVIATLTDGQTQASLMAELGVIAPPKAMPNNNGGGAQEEETSAGQLAFHFFSTVASPLTNARTNPEYKKLLMALPVESDSDHPLSLSTLEVEARAFLADIEEAKQANAKPAKGKVVAA